MATVGGVYVPDDLMPTMGAPAKARPGMGEIFSAAAEGAVGAVQYGVPYAYKKLANELQPGDEAYYQKGLYEANQAASAAAPASVGDLTSGKVGIARFIGENLVGSLPYMVSGAVGAVGGGLAAGPAGAVGGFVAGSMPQFVGTNVSRAVEEQGGLSDVGAANAVIASAPQAASETLVGRYLPGIGGAMGFGAIGKVGDGFLKRTAKSIVEAGLTEAVTEAGQQMGERAAAGIPLATPDAAAEYVNAAVTAFAVGGALGAGGGFRRSNALAKPAGDVTPDDMMAHIDAALSGSSRVGQLALPAPADFIGGADGQTRVNPNGNAPIALPSPEMIAARYPQTDAVVDAAGRVSSDVPAPILANLPRESTPGLDLAETQNTYADNLTQPVADALVTGVPPAPNAPLSTTTSLTPLPGRLTPLPENPAAPLEPQVTLPAEQDFKPVLEEAKKGLQTNQWVKKLDAADEFDLMGKVYDQVFTEQDTRSGTVKLAQRLGILNEDLTPGPVAEEVEARRAAGAGTAAAQNNAGGAVETAPRAAPTAEAPASSPAIDTSAPDPAALAEVEQAKKAIGVQRAGNLATLNTPADVFNQLAVDRSEAKRGGQATRVEQLAKTLGLITNDDAMDYTPKGRQVYLQSAQGIEATTSAAADNGFIGASASQFDRGARAQISGQEQTTFSGFEEMAAYNAGKKWAADFVANGEVKTAEQTRGVMARQEARKTGTAVARKSVERTQLSPQQIRQQSLNSLLDAADLRTVNDTDIAELRRMAREGVEPEVLGQALTDVQGGKTLFKPAALQVEKKVWSPLPGRGGQPRFVETNTAERRINEKAGNRAETEAAVKAYEMRSLIDFALREKAITKQRAERLHGMLDDGKVDAVAKNMKAFNEFRGRLGENDLAFEQGIDGKDFNGVLDYMIEEAPSAYHRLLMKGVQGLAQKLQRAGVTMEFKIAKNGDTVPLALTAEGTRAISEVTRVPPTNTVWVKSTERGPDGGMNYQIVAHEMIHAVSQLIIDQYGQQASALDAGMKRAAGELVNLANEIKGHLDGRIEQAQRGGPALNAFEQQYADRMSNAFADTDEILAWGLTNPDMQRYLASLQIAPRQSVWSKLVDLVRRLLSVGVDGIEPVHNNALDELLRVSERIFNGTQGEVTRMILDSRFDRGQGVLMAAASEAATSANNRTVEATGATLQDFAAKSTQIVNSLKESEIRQIGRRTAMRWLSHNQLNRTYGARSPGLLKHTDAHRFRDAVRSNFEALGDEVYQAFEKLERENAKAAGWVGQLMATTTEFQIDPDKTWEEHTHIAEQDRERIKPMYDAAVKMKNDLSRGNGAGYAIFQQFRQFNEAQNFARLAASLHNLVALDPELSLGVTDLLVNPTEEFLKAEGVTSGPAIRDWWHGTLIRQIAAMTDFVNAKKGEVAGTEASAQLGMRQHLSPIEMQISATHEALAAMQRAPYFHLGRFGSYFGSASVRTNADGTVNPEAMEQVAAALEAAGFDDVQLSPGNNRARVMLRFDKASQVNRFKAVMTELHKAGVLEGELGTAVKSGARDRTNNFGQVDGFPQFVTSYIEALEASPVYTPDPGMTAEEKDALAQRKEEAIRLAVDTWLEAQPDTSISKVLAKRYTVPGYKKDMIRNFAHRWRVGAISLANVASAPKFNEAFVDMRSAVEEAKSGDSEADQFLLNDLLAEVKARDATTPINDNADSFDKARAIAHSYFLGLSPAYAFINMTQMGVVALPELAKKHGYSKSFHAMRRATGDAFKILKAAFDEARQLGPENWASVAITESVLTKAGLDPKVASFALRMIANGTIDIGSQARSLGQVSENRVGSKLDTGLKYASALGMYSETFSRLVTALAANDLHPGDLDSSADYATGVVSESMLDYQSWNTARALGKKGILGPVTPIVTQFMSYSVQMTEKLLSEFVVAAGRGRPGESAESIAQRKQEARRFLAGHLTAIVALTGSLGLPFLTVFATALERLIDDDDSGEPFDITATYRGWLTDVLGKDVAEVASRGLPRALGFDLSSRAGEQNLLPFSEFFADRRPWKDAIEANASRSMGAVPSMVTNIISGGGKIADGDVVGGLKDIVPVAFKGPVEAYRMSDQGYVDSKGNKLPMSPKAAAMVYQLLGLTPAEKAEYSEIRGDITSRKGEIARRAGVLRDGIVKAILQRDTATVQSLLTEAQQFDQDNPSVQLVASVPAALQRQVMSGVRASALETPLGVSMMDIAGQNMSRYANVSYGP